ncbi:MAG: DNA methyltransferase [Acidimicrobiia bacterium]
MSAQARLFSRRLLQQAVEATPEPTAEQMALAATWSRIAADPAFRLHNERPHQGRFLTEFFGTLLGYRSFGASTDGAYELTAEEASSETRGGQTPDGQLGFFGRTEPRTVAVIELKKPSVDLDTRQASRADRRTPVEQAFGYVPKFDGCRWVIVSNFVTIRLYWAARGEGYFWECDVSALAEPRQVSELLRVLHRDNLLGVDPAGDSATTTLAHESRLGERELTESFYTFFKRSRAELFESLVSSNPPPEGAGRSDWETGLLRHTQTILDRLLFVCFAEDTELLPRRLLRTALDHAGAGFASSSRWDQLRGLFAAINAGLPDRGIHGYNGGLFATDALLERLEVDDAAFEFVYAMSEYDFSDQLGVEVLGRVFERSIVDIEALHAEIDPAGLAPDHASARSRRSQDGIFYTPDWVTRFLATRALTEWVDERFTQLRNELGVDAVPEGHTARRRSAEIAFWERWQLELRSIRVLDPACGSGAFLVAAFDALLAEYERANASLADLRGGQAGLFDPNKDILESNLYGVDINSESVEITRLSLWLKTARKGRTLTSLSNTIRCGNSLVHPVQGAASSTFEALPSSVRAAAFDWRSEFPEVFDPEARDGRVGFDIVIGNPPYVRGEWLDASLKDYLESNYAVFGRRADLLVYFYERAIELMAPAGRLGFIVSNKWLKAGYGEPLRRFLSDRARLTSLIDFGHAPIFQDADTFPIITMLTQGSSDATPPDVMVAAVPREELGAAAVAQLVADRGFRVHRGRFTADPWSLEPPAVQALLDHLQQRPTLTESLGLEPLLGIKTGLNEAYVIDQRTRDRLVTEHPPAAAIIQPVARGSTVGRWTVHASDYLIALSSSDDRAWPWTDAPDPEDTFAATYPSVYRWLVTDQRPGEARRHRLVTRGDQGRFWWELRRCQYYDLLTGPKLVYTDIAWQPEVGVDQSGVLLLNTAYFIPGNNKWTAAVLNSPLMWWYAWRTFQHGKDEALRWFTSSVANVPYADDVVGCGSLLEELVRTSGDRRAAHRATLDWLRSECNVVRPGSRLGNPNVLLSADDFIEEAKKHGRFERTSAAVTALRREHGVLATAMTGALAAEEGLERQIAAAVEAAFGLNEEQAQIVRDTAPPRTPLYWKP